MDKEKNRKKHPFDPFLISYNSNLDFIDSIGGPLQPDSILTPQHQLPKQKQSNLLTYSQLEYLFTTILDQLTNTTKCENNNKVQDETIKKVSQCLSAIMKDSAETPERLLLNINICLSLWKTMGSTNRVNFQRLNQEFVDKWGIENKINKSFSIIYLSVPYINSQYKNMMQYNENMSKKLMKKGYCKLQHRYCLFLIVCAKQFYQEKMYEEASTIVNEAIQDIILYSESSIRELIKTQADILGLKFKAYYLLYKVSKKLNRDQEEMNSIEKCLEVLSCSNFVLNKETSDGANKQDKTEVIEKLRYRLKTVKQKKQERGSQRKFHRRKIPSLSKQKSHSKLEIPKKQGSMEKEQTSYYEKTHSISQKGYKFMDFKNTTKKYHNKYLNSDTSNNFLMGNTGIANTTKMRNTGNMKPEEKYQIKVHKLAKKGYQTLNSKQYTFKTLMQELQEQKSIGGKDQQKFCTDYSNLLLLRPNEKKNNFQFIKQPSNMVKRESKLTQIDPDMIVDMKISNYDGSLYNLGSKFTIQGNSKFKNPCEDSARQQKIIRAVAEAQKQTLSKFINNYDKIIKKKNRQIAEERKSSESSENFLENDNQFCREASSRMLLENICGPREPRTRKQKIFHTIQQVIIPQVILPNVGLVDQVRAGIRRVKDRQMTHSHNNTVSFADNEVYAFHVKIFTQKHGVVCGERQLYELKAQDALSMEEKIMYMAQIDPANFIEKADLTTNICGYALEYLLLSFMKRYFSWKNKGLGITLNGQSQIITLKQLAAPRNRMQAYHQVNVYQQGLKTFDEINSKMSSMMNSNIQPYRNKFPKIILGSKTSFNFSRSLPYSDQLLKFRLHIILINENNKQKSPQNSIQNGEQCLLGEDLHLPALIHRICTQTSCTFKQIEPQIHNDIISCFFMARQPEFMRNYFLRSMKFILITNETEIMKFYYESWNFSFLFRLSNNREYSINWTHYKSKSLYSLSNFFFMKIEFEQKNHRTRKNKLLMTSEDLEKWNSEYSNLNAKLTPFNMKQIFYEMAESLMKQISMRRSMNAFKFGFSQRGENSQQSSVSSDYFYTNCFRSINSNFSNHENFLSPELKNVHIMYQKMIKLKFCHSYGIVTITNIAKSKIYDFIVYVPSTQNYLGFTLPHHIFIDQKTSSSPDWADVVRRIQFEVKGSKEKIYYIAKVLNHQAFIQDNVFIEYFSINNNIYKMAVTIEEKKAPLNFQSKPKNLKNKIKRLLDVFDVQSKQYRKAFMKIYSSQASKYMIYISITQTSTVQSFIQSYYLKQLISLIYSKGKKNSNNPFMRKSLGSSKGSIFDEGLIQLSNLMLIFHILAKTYIEELSSNHEAYFEKGDNTLTKSCQAQQKDIFTSIMLQSQLRNNIENKMIKETVQNSWNASKINLNSPISKCNHRADSVIYLHKKLQFHKNNVPVSCIMYDVSSRKFFICLDNYKKGKIVYLQVDEKLNSMPFIQIIAANPKVMIGARNRLAKQWKNLLLIS